MTSSTASPAARSSSRSAPSASGHASARQHVDICTTTTPVWGAAANTNSASVIDSPHLAWLRNDLAIAQHHAGEDAACLVTLEPLAESRDAHERAAVRLRVEEDAVVG